jgi:Tfp pilus assembly protein PilO
MYIEPNYQGDNLGGDKRSVISLQKEDDEYLKALNTIQEIIKKRDALEAKRGQISAENLAKLDKILPDSIDNIQLVIEMNQVAQLHALTLKNLKVDSATKTDQNKTSQTSQDTGKYGTVGLSFSVSASYSNFQSFLDDLERSLRLLEITDLSISSSETGVYDFTVSLKTYWLK